MLTDREKLEQHLKKFKYVTAEVRQKILERVDKYAHTHLSPHEIVYCGFRWDEAPEGIDYWYEIANLYEGYFQCEDTPPKTPVESTISQSEKQQLLSILRAQLKFVTSEKIYYKEASHDAWEQSTKDTQVGQEYFEIFSMFNKSKKHYKKEESKIANLIKKVKAL